MRRIILDKIIYAYLALLIVCILLNQNFFPFLTNNVFSHIKTDKKYSLYLIVDHKRNLTYFRLYFDKFFKTNVGYHRWFRTHMYSALKNSEENRKSFFLVLKQNGREEIKNASGYVIVENNLIDGVVDEVIYSENK